MKKHSNDPQKKGSGPKIKSKTSGLDFFRKFDEIYNYYLIDTCIDENGVHAFLSPIDTFDPDDPEIFVCDVIEERDSGYMTKDVVTVTDEAVLRKLVSYFRAMHSGSKFKINYNKKIAVFLDSAVEGDYDLMTMLI